MKKNRKWIGLLLAIAMAFGLLSGCGTPASSMESATSSAPESVAPTTEATQEPTEVSSVEEPSTIASLNH